MYHLKKLLSQKFVTKTGDTYKLTAAGQRFVDKLSLKNLKPRIQPKIVTLIACRNRRNEWLFYRRNRQPFFKLIGFPYGKIHLGETIQLAAERELTEKTGLATKLTHAGDVYLAVSDTDGDLITHMLCHVFTGSNPTGTLLANSSIGECFWSKLTDLPNTQLMPGVLEIYKLIDQPTKGRFFAEYALKE